MNDLFKLKREFLEYCELDKGQSALTITGYDRYLSKFLEWLKKYKQDNSKQITDNRIQITDNKPSDAPDQDHQPSTINHQLVPEDIDQEAVRQYRLYVNRLSDRYGKELKKNTQNYHILALRAFLRYLAFRGINSLSPEKVSIAKTGDREITFLESEEIGSILNSPDTDSLSGLRDRSILEILFSTGLRVSELAALNVSDLNFERGEIAVLGKGQKIRVVFLSESSIKTVKEYLISREISIDNIQSTDSHVEHIRQVENKKSQTIKNDKIPLFLSNKETRLTVRSIERIVKKYSAKAGLTKKVSPHTLRHSFATDLLISGADIRSVQSLLGHSSITTTQIYTHVTDQHLREVHQKYHGKSLSSDKNEDSKKDNDVS